MVEYLQSLKVERKIPFTAGDFVDSLSFLEPVRRRAVLFALEHKLSLEEVINLTHFAVRRYDLTPLTKEIVKQSPRHIRLQYVFWQTLSNGVVAPLIGLQDDTCAAFGGMSWEDVRIAYGKMVWVDFEFDALHFIDAARQLGLEL